MKSMGGNQPNKKQPNKPAPPHSGKTRVRSGRSSGPAQPAPSADHYTRKQKQKLRRKEENIEKRLKEIQKQEEIEEVKREGIENFYFFCEKIMGYKDLYQPLHSKVCNFISDSKSTRRMILIPRGHFKTTIASICYPIWRLLRNPAERIALISVTSDLAEDNLKEVIIKIDGSRFQSLYSDRIPPSKTWPFRRGYEYRCPRKGAKTGPSLYSCGVESSETGRHFSLMIMDDIVNDANTRSREQLAKIWDWFGRQGSVIDPDGEIVVSGTRWSWGDPYSKIEDLSNWKKMILAATDKKGNVIFPTLFSKKLLAEKRKIQGDYRYSCFYENNPTGAGLNPFNINRFKWVEYTEKHPEAYRYILVDPATTTKEWSHPTGIIIGDALPDKTFVVIEAIREKLEPDSLVSRIISLCRKHNPYDVVVESDAAHTTVVFWLRQKILDAKLKYHVTSFKNPVQIGKETRTINTLQPRLHNGAVLFSENFNGRDLLLEEFRTFPRGRTDDLIQALASVTSVHFPRSFEIPTKKILDRRTIIFNNMIKKNGKKHERKKRKIPTTRMRFY